MVLFNVLQSAFDKRIKGIPSERTQEKAYDFNILKCLKSVKNDKYLHLFVSILHDLRTNAHQKWKSSYLDSFIRKSAKRERARTIALCAPSMCKRLSRTTDSRKDDRAKREGKHTIQTIESMLDDWQAEVDLMSKPAIAEQAIGLAQNLVTAELQKSICISWWRDVQLRQQSLGGTMALTIVSTHTHTPQSTKKRWLKKESLARVPHGRDLSEEHLTLS